MLKFLSDLVRDPPATVSVGKVKDLYRGAHERGLLLGYEDGAADFAANLRDAR